MFAPHKGILVYILLDSKQVSVYTINNQFNYNGETKPLLMPEQQNIEDAIKIDHLFEKIRAHGYRIDQCGYGFMGNQQNNKVWNYFKHKFKGAHKIGAKSIKIKFAKIFASIANTYTHGKYNLPKNEEKAFYFNMEALSWWNLPMAMLSMAYQLAFGKGTAINTNHALELFEKILNLDHGHYHQQNISKFHLEIIKGEACYYLGYIYQFGAGVQINTDKAKYYYELGNQLKDTKCMQIKL